jgi:hypothetical protein
MKIRVLQFRDLQFHLGATLPGDIDDQKYMTILTV